MTALKTHIKLLLVGVSVLFFASCQKLQSGLDDSVNTKINALVDSYVEELTDADYGWIAYIETSKGYYQFWFDFDENGKVTMCTDNTAYRENKGKPMVGTYLFRPFQRPTLVFDTYSYIHLINDPDDDVSHGSKNQGLKTDFEFEVVKWDRDAQVFRMSGRFNKVNAIFRRASVMDKEGALSGKMMDVLDTCDDKKWSEHYLRANYNGTEVILKLSDNRNMYVFRFDTDDEKGDDGKSYYNVMFDQSNNIVFPEAIEIRGAYLTGLKYDASKKTYTEIVTDQPDVLIPLEIRTLASPELKPSDVFGPIGSDKVYNQASASGILIPKPIGPDGSVTANALDIRAKMLINGGFNLILSYDLNYFFTKIRKYEDDPESEEMFFNISFTPRGFGITSIDTGTGGEYQTVTSYPTGTYKFKITEFDSRDMSFALGGYSTSTDGDNYVAGKVMDDVVNGFKDKRFAIRWSDVASPVGLVIDFVPVKLDGSTPSRHKEFVSPAILTNRGK